MNNLVSLPKLDWTIGLIKTAAGCAHGNLFNGCHALRNNPQLQLLLAYNDFSMKSQMVRSPPWDFELSKFSQRDWTQLDDLRLTEYLQSVGIPLKPQTAAQAVEIIARERPYHPVLDYLDTLEWDKKPRLDQWLTDYVGALETPYTQTIGRAALIGAVARVRDPGCKVDTIPIIEGGQGIGKSSAARAMFEPWFSDEIAVFGSKDASMQAQGVWLIEISELDAMTRREVSKIKAFVSRTTDRFRPPYGARLIESNRSCVFWGTTNSDSYLKDETGGRRFWPIKAGKIDLGGLKAARDQLWAEADRLYQAGAAWWLVNPEAKRIAEGEQSARYQSDPWEELIGDHLNRVADVSVIEILRDILHLEISRWGQAEQNRVARCLKARGLVRYQAGTGDNRSWRYRKVG